MVRQGGFLPEADRAPAGATTVLLHLHEGCEVCGAYLERVRGSRAEFDVWGARCVLRRGGDSPYVVVADRYGHVFYAVEASGHQFPAPRELEEWVKYLGTLCPE